MRENWQMIGPTKLLGKGIFVFGKLIFKYWWIAITLLMILSGFISSINDGLEQQDLKIPLRFLGTEVLSADEGIYEVVQDLEFELPKKENFVGKIGYYFDFIWYLITNLWRHLWMVLFSFMIFYKIPLFFLGDASKKLRATVISILIMAFLQILMSGIPFRGLFELTKFVMGVLSKI